jgi:hypothetical protein
LLKKERIMNATRKRRPLQPVHGTAKWLRRPADKVGQDPKSGLLEINGTLYSLLIHETAYELRKGDGTSYNLPLDLSGCDCPDATFASERPGGCKHRKGLTALLRAIGM